MKSFFLIPLTICLFISFNVSGQAEKIIIEKGNIEPLVQLVENLNADDGYKKINEWVNFTYKDADAVIGSSIENRFLRFTGIKQNFATSFGYVYDLEYTIRIEFKDNKYRLTVDNLRSGNSGVFADFNLSDYYKKDGEPRKSYKDFTDGIEIALSDLNSSIFNYLTGVTEKVNDDW